MLKKVLLTPLQKFIKIESFSGILLLLATITAIVWANSGFAGSYQALWQYELGIVTDSFEFKKPLILWVNDGLMAIFFFLIGLEIKRELIIGELNSMKKLAFPLFGALGGMIVPVLFFILLNENPETLKGWGIPMATDIAFSLAVLNVLGNRVPLSLKIFLTAFAIVDDIGAVLVIAVFYSGTINLTLLLIAALLLGLVYYLSYKGQYSPIFLFIVACAVWVLFLKSGIHPTVAGILLAFSVPVRQKIQTEAFLNNLEVVYENMKKADVLNEPILSKQQLAQIGSLDNWSKKFKSPLQLLEHKLHGWVAYLVIPVFALANAGVMISSDVEIDLALTVHIIIALVLGKGIGIPLIVFVAKKLKIITVPDSITKMQIIGVSFLAGIGFTMAIFITSLAFMTTPQYIDSAKIGILIASVIAAISGYIILRYSLPKENSGDEIVLEE
ncbi:Na+/H+ antiporter NhaA [Bizionia argentinensis JUB59]|uniref:Na(+)/H(+) antiporter NhaA n=1 Tax=Bizionia argentinensis JUB59 TaxID=1046627 RepID=G2EHM0_9FLAO|nr:Na+/H+ antiporter NhaA [Bizionia argentinensis]EGV42058.1 Na+/H+ antiporter NhaA [Bizionia argentinensis JUB59]